MLFRSVAQMENKENGIRSYRVERATPDGLSYAKDIAARYGLLCESYGLASMA